MAEVFDAGMETPPPPAPSPFIEGTKLQYAVDGTSISLVKECARKYQYTIIEQWRKKSDSVHLSFGGDFASCLEFFHKQKALGDTYEEALDATVQRLAELTEGWKSDHPKKNKFTLFRTVIWYLDSYRDDPAHTVILASGEAAVELTFKIPLDFTTPTGENYLYCGHLDRLVQYGDDIFVQDQKTTGSGLGSYFFAQFNPDNQMSGYTFAGRILYNIPIAGVMIDGAQILVNSTSFARGFTMRTEAQLEEWYKDLGYWLKLMESYVEQDYWPMNDKSCHKYDGCVFREVCSQDPAVRQNYLETQFEKREWNPLKSR